MLERMTFIKFVKPRRIFFLFLSVACLALSSAGGTVKDLAASIPKKILGWEAAGKDMIYDRKTLYDYMDGGAEVILAFDFKEVLARKFKDAAGDEITLDIYDMGSSTEAFGIFSCERMGEEVRIGQESQYGDGLLRFWQGRYFVSIMTPGDEKKAEKAILELGKSVAVCLGPAGAPPDLLQRLPESGLEKNTVSYFHSVLNLNNRFFVASENILNLGPRTDCVFAEYTASPKESASLLIVSYPDEASCRSAERSFRQSFLPEAGVSGAALTETHKWTMVRTHGNYLAIVFESPSREYADSLQSAIRFPRQ
jgi:hypothetical protein